MYSQNKAGGFKVMLMTEIKPGTLPTPTPSQQDLKKDNDY